MKFHSLASHLKTFNKLPITGIGFTNVNTINASEILTEFGLTLTAAGFLVTVVGYVINVKSTTLRDIVYKEENERVKELYQLFKTNGC